MTRRLVGSGGPWEATGGYSRAISVADACWVAGTTDAGPDRRSQHPDDVAAQTRATLAIIERALDESGFGLQDVVRIRMFVTDIGRSDEVLRIIGDVFATIRPAATIVEVRALMDPSLLIEIEAEARRD